MSNFIKIEGLFNEQNHQVFVDRRTCSTVTKEDKQNHISSMQGKITKEQEDVDELELL